VTENSTTFEIGLLVPGLIAPLDPKAGIGATMPPAGAGNVRCPAIPLIKSAIDCRQRRVVIH
jgi:hypothetical protein